MEEKRRKREAAQKAAAEKRAAAKGNKPDSPPSEPEDGCIIDNLLKEIKSGTTLRSTNRKTVRRTPKLSADELSKLKKKMAAHVSESKAAGTEQGERKEEEGKRERGEEREGSKVGGNLNMSFSGEAIVPMEMPSLPNCSAGEGEVPKANSGTSVAAQSDGAQDENKQLTQPSPTSPTTNTADNKPSSPGGVVSSPGGVATNEEPRSKVAANGDKRDVRGLSPLEQYMTEWNQDSEQVSLSLFLLVC